ncbi:PAS domain-containing sensor histidine kinase [Salinigranum salinum]|uniref:PAS domain-containing sensor histidine kinase n=1 Tax=Salinigranum salinum TaxID=1364937 RepID=UPI001260F807|nr:ATP-binding protein [Salinigranum salinum]
MTHPSLQSALNAVGDVIVTADAGGAVVAWNGAFADAVGTSDGLVGRPLAELVADADRATVTEALATVREEGHARVDARLGPADDGVRYEFRFDRLAGGETDADGADLTGDEDIGATVVGVGRELTPRRNRRVDTDDRDRPASRETLAEQETVLREMYEIVAARDRTFTARVEALLELGCETLGTGYGTLSSIDGDEYVFEVVRTPNDEIRPGETVPLSATNCERAITTERTLVLADIARDAPDLAERAGFTDWGIACYLGAPVYVDDDVYGTFCFYDEQPRTEPFSEWEVTLVDLMSRWVSAEVERRNRIERLQETNDQLERFATVVSHDLRNPLSIIEGSLELAERTGDADHLERARRALARMERLVDDLLTLARAGETIDDPSPVALAAVARDAWETVDPDDATLVAAVDGVVVADEPRLRQLFANLFQNSVEHGSTSSRPRAGDSVEHGSTGSRPGVDDSVEHGSTSSRPEVDDFTRGAEATGNGDDHEPHADPGTDTDTDDHGVTVRLGRLADGFFVEDDGAGIPADASGQVFEWGYSTNDEGTGIGLSIVSEIAAAHGWDVRMTDGTDGGARFEFTGVDVAADAADLDGAADDGDGSV